MLTTQLFRFGIIGLLALSVHLFSVMVLARLFNISPLGANILGFFLAFHVSYWGHYKWTFEADDVSHKSTAIRFFTIAFSNFIINEVLYASLLYNTNLPYDIALFIVLIFVAVWSFILSKFWVFR